MAAPDSILIVKDRIKGEIIIAKRYPSEALLSEWPQIINSFPFPAYNLELLSVFDDPYAMLSTADADAVITMLPDALKIDDDDPWSESLPSPKPKAHRSEVESSEMNDEKVIECLGRFGPDMFIVAGELNCRVYTKRFVDCLFRQFTLYDRLQHPVPYQGRCRIVCGPVIVIADSSSGNRADSSVLPALTSHDKVEIYISSKRQAEHFRLAKDGLYYETPHPPNAVHRDGFVSFYDTDVLRTFRLKADAVLAGENVRKCVDFRNEFVFLTESELTKLCSHLEDRGEDFGSADVQAIQDRLWEIGVDWKASV